MPTLALLHGFTGSPTSWDGVEDHLPAEIAILRPPLLGHGADEPGVNSFEAEADRLAAIVAPDDPVDLLCGYSLGGRLALTLALRHADRVRRLVLVGAHPGLESAAERAERRVADRRWIALLENEGIEAFVDAWEALPLFADQSELASETRAAQRAARLRHDPRDLARSLRVTGLAEMAPTRSQLPALSIPVMLVAGERDAKFRDLAAEMEALLPQSELQVVTDCGHNVPLARPAALAKLLVAALEENV